MYFCIMIELAQHIEKLLLDNDCVIVPGLGGFVAHYTPSTRIEEEHLFLPPRRVIGFNPQVKINDGLLVQSYMETYNTNFADATRLVDKQVAELVQSLHEEGKADLQNIGQLHCSIDNTYEFTPYNNKITTPYLYGLTGFEMKALESIRSVSTRKPEPDYLMPDKRNSRKVKFEINLKPSHWLNAAAMIAIVMLSFLLSAPIENTEVMKGNYASLLPDAILQKASRQSLALTPIMTQTGTQPVKPIKEHVLQTPQKQNKKVTVPVAVREVKANVPAPTDKISQTETSVLSTPSVKKYHIIVASVSTENDARQLVKQLTEKGFKGASAIIGDGKKRVSIESCATYAEARQTLNEIQKDEAYKNAWILKH